MSIYYIGDMTECSHEEYRRIYDKHKDNLTVFSSYSGGIIGMPEMSTAWGIKGMEAALIASECENWEHRREDPAAWMYWANKDLVMALDRESDHAAEVERLTAERDAAVARAEKAEALAGYVSSDRILGQLTRIFGACQPELVELRRLIAALSPEPWGGPEGEE